MPEHPESDSDSDLRNDTFDTNALEQLQVSPEEMQKALQPILEGFNQVLREHGIQDVEVISFRTTSPPAERILENRRLFQAGNLSRAHFILNSCSCDPVTQHICWDGNVCQCIPKNQACPPV